MLHQSPVQSHRPHIEEPDDLEPGLPPVEPDDGLVPPIIPDDAEHDRVISPELSNETTP